MCALITLVAAWCAMAFIEYLHWRFWELPLEFMIDQARMRDVRAQIELLDLYNSCINMAESMYEATSAWGVPYSAGTRRHVAEAIGVARKSIDDRVGPKPFIVYERSQNRWPFDADGKVKL